MEISFGSGRRPFVVYHQFTCFTKVDDLPKFFSNSCISGDKLSATAKAFGLSVVVVVVVDKGVNLTL